MAPKVEIKNEALIVDGEEVRNANWGFLRRRDYGNFIFYYVYDVSDNLVTIERQWGRITPGAPSRQVLSMPDLQFTADVRAVIPIICELNDDDLVDMTHEQFFAFVNEFYGATLEEGEAELMDKRLRAADAIA